jgi:hypothetical protein
MLATAGAENQDFHGRFLMLAPSLETAARALKRPGAKPRYKFYR